MLRFFNGIRPVPSGLLGKGRFWVGNDSDNDFKKVTKTTAQPQQEITQQNVTSIIDGWVRNNSLCLFMKGTPAQPQCGYSKTVVAILAKEGVKNGYFSYNILSNAVVREQLKMYSKWPTYPQLYVKGKLVGGCDIVRQMHAEGSLRKLLQQSGLI